MHVKKMASMKSATIFFEEVRMLTSHLLVKGNHRHCLTMMAKYRGLPLLFHIDSAIRDDVTITEFL